jgi:hypothetical protein
MKKIFLFLTVIFLFGVHVYSMNQANQQLENVNAENDNADMENILEQPQERLPEQLPIFQIQENNPNQEENQNHNQTINALMLQQLSLQRMFQLDKIANLENKFLNLKNAQITHVQQTNQNNKLYDEKFEEQKQRLVALEKKCDELEKKIQSSFFLKISDSVYLIFDYTWKNPIKVLFITGVMAFLVVTIYDLYVGTLLMADLYYYLIGFLEKFFKAIKNLDPSRICPVEMQEAILHSSDSVKVTTASRIFCLVYKFITRFVG